MIRRIYCYLLRLHPDRFRQRFGDEMLSIFDESARDRNRPRLILDALASIFRQRVLRSRYSASPQLRLHHPRSERLRKRAQWANLAWALAAIPLQAVVATALSPATVTVGAGLLYAFLPVTLVLTMYGIFSRGLACSVDDFASIANRPDAGRIQLERKRDSLQMWAEYMGPVLICTLLAFVSVAASGLLLGRSSAGRSWLWVDMIVFAIQSASFFSLLKRLNERAACAVQHEIEAMVALAK